jgi:hypothetical protein
MFCARFIEIVLVQSETRPGGEVPEREICGIFALPVECCCMIL